MMTRPLEIVPGWHGVGGRMRRTGPVCADRSRLSFHALRGVLGLALLFLISGLAWGQAASERAGTLRLEDVLASVTNRYPPLLAALIERDIAAGRLRSAQGAFDFQTFAKATGVPQGYYESLTVDAGFEQFTGIWGSTIFGGYRITKGDLLPDYYKERTQGSGEPRLGLKVPLLKDGAIDRRRAAIMQARLDRELADPFILRQQLDFIRAASMAHAAWLASGRRWKLAEDLLRVASERGLAMTNQAASGLIPKIVLTDNQRLVVSRQLGVVQARRRFEASSIALSLFYRDAEGNPIVVGREMVPPDDSIPAPPDSAALDSDIAVALAGRPEIRRFKLSIQRAEVDLRLARNQTLPSLDAGVAVSRDFGDKIYKDKSETEVEAGIEFKMPLQRRDALGRVDVAEAMLQRLSAEERMARDRVAAEVRDSHSALRAAWEQLAQARLNVELATELVEAENTRFQRGAADLLAVQIREQSGFEARNSEVDLVADYLRAVADYRAATAVDARPMPSIR